jgi:DNA-directed DNA polymerase III (polc)
MKDAYENSTIPGVHETLQYAQMLEGTVRQTGVHACAVIIGRDNLMEHIPICIAKDKETGEDMWVSQYEGSFIEDVGMLKMDFLGLRTLSIIKETISNIKKHRGIDLDIDNISLTDKKTYELFCKGDTIATFQFESPGMQKWLRELKPSKIEDLIAMNALYRPGPMDYIPDFVDRKLGRKKIEYDLPEMEETLKDTYGVTVYQEQVMLLSQRLAGFSKGKADMLRKAMGKKQIDKMLALYQDFLKGGEEHGHPKEILEKIWKDWTAFAEYAFNKSHATCYTWVAYQTAYLKANYPAEFMAANLSKNLNNIDEITKLMDDCRHLGIKVLGPDVNESDRTFSVNKEGNIRFGMAGVKGVGGAIADMIVECRGDKPFESIFEFMERISIKCGINKKTIESLAYAGAFDSFGNIRRDQFFTSIKDEIFIESLCRYGSRLASDSSSSINSLFGDADIAFKPVPPEIPPAGEYNKLEFLKREKELVGMYLSAHPLDNYKFEIENFTTSNISTIKNLEKEASNDESLWSKVYYIAGLVANVNRKLNKNGKPWIEFSIEDYTSSVVFRLFGKDYEAFMPYIVNGEALLLKVVIQPRFLGYQTKQNVQDDVEKQSGPIECETRIKKISLLSNTKENFIKSFTINLPISTLDKKFRKEFVSKLKSNKGKKLLCIKIIDSENKMSVEFFSKKYTVDVNDNLIDYLTHQGLSYSTEFNINL